MSYLEKNSEYKVEKKNVGARVSEVVLSALNKAKKDSTELGYTFSVSLIIEKALQDTLTELFEKTGMDYLALEQFRFEMNRRQVNRKIETGDSTWVDVERIIHEIKLKTLNDLSVDMDLLLKKEEKKITDYWDKYVINRKEQTVKSELDQIKSENEKLHGMLTYEQVKNIDHEGQQASNEGWGKIYMQSYEVGDEARDSYLDDHSELIEAIRKRSNQGGSIALPDHLLDQWKTIEKMYTKDRS